MIITLQGHTRVHFNENWPLSKIDQNPEKSKGFSQWNFWVILAMCSNPILSTFIQVVTSLCFQNAVETEKFCKFKDRKQHQKFGCWSSIVWHNSTQITLSSWLLHSRGTQEFISMKIYLCQKLTKIQKDPKGVILVMCLNQILSKFIQVVTSCFQNAVECRCWAPVQSSCINCLTEAFQPGR